ncbi:MAG TPA: amidohydrolase [Planctomycetota bacterium]|nr:amidohydrolase [Planctomycetota bacterium]
MRTGTSRKIIVLSFLLISPTWARAAPAGGARGAALAWVDDNKKALFALHRFVWEAAEVGLEEERSSAEMARVLGEHGFRVERGAADMPTAFVASYGSGKPVIAILAEYDALPGMSQAAEPRPSPRVEGGAGHACGHSVLGAASAGAAIAVRYAMESYRIKGTLRLYGTPAEETGIGKTYMVKEGLFSDCDAALHWHPSDRNVVTYSHSKAVVSVKYTFQGLAAHASFSPQDGRSALDAVELMNIGANYLREHLKEDARIHYVITAGGGQPNVVPPTAQVWYYLRANSHRDVEALFARMEKIARGAALMTETEVKVQVDSDSHELLPNRVISEILQLNLEEVGPPSFTEAEREFARKTQEPLVVARGCAFVKALSDSIEPLSAEPDLIRASTDVGDVSWMVPTSGIRVACYAQGAPGHSWQIVAATGMSIGEKGLETAMRTLALSAVDLLQKPELVEAAQAELAERRKKEPYTTLVPKEQKAPRRIR